MYQKRATYGFLRRRLLPFYEHYIHTVKEHIGQAAVLGHKLLDFGGAPSDVCGCCNAIVRL